MSAETTGIKLKKCKSPQQEFAVDRHRELILFRLKLSNRSECDLYDVVVRMYDAVSNELISTYPLGVYFKSRRLRNDTEVFTPYKNEHHVPDYVKRIRFNVEHMRSEPGFRTDFEIKFDLF